MPRCDKPEPGEVAGGVMEPPPRLDGPSWKRRVEHRGVASHGRPVAARAVNDEDPPQATTIPPSFGRQKPWDDPHLLREGHEHRLEVRQDRLDLDDEQHACSRMPRDDIDRPALAELVERQLGDRLPAKRTQLGESQLDQGRMTSIDQAIDHAALPAKFDALGDLERPADVAKASDGDANQLATFDERDGLLVDAGAARNVELS